MFPLGPNWYFMGFPPLYIASSAENRTAYAKSPHVVAMIGLPGRGKTSTAFKISRYFNWIGFNSRVFCLDECAVPCEEHESFKDMKDMKQQHVISKLQEICSWLESGGEVAVLDSDNLTIERRSLINDAIVLRMGFKLFFIEMICMDQKIVESNIAEAMATGREEPVLEFMKKIFHCQKVYEELNKKKEPHLSFMKIFDSGKKFEIHKHEGHIQGRIIYFVINIRVIPHVIYLTRHGESEMNVQCRIGGDSVLSEHGMAFAQALARFVEMESVPHGLRVWTSWMKRTIQTAAHIRLPQERWKALNEINAGICEGLTYEEIKIRYPKEYEARQKDKLNYRYPNGESYKDVIGRLEPIIMEMERQGNILVVTHQSIMRCLLAFFLDIPADELPVLQVCLHTIYKLTIVASGLKLEQIKLPVVATSAMEYDEVEVVSVERIIPGTNAENLQKLISLQGKRERE